MTKDARSLNVNIKYEACFIGKVLTSNTRGPNRIDVPLYQRHAWKKDKVSVLFEDLLAHHNDKADNAYYLGQLVFINQGDRIEILDGQQRLTTLYIFINALVNSLEQLRQDIKNHPSFEAGAIADWEENIDGEINLIRSNTKRSWRMEKNLLSKERQIHKTSTGLIMKKMFNILIFFLNQQALFLTPSTKILTKDIKLLCGLYSFDEIKTSLINPPETMSSIINESSVSFYKKTS